MPSHAKRISVLIEPGFEKLLYSSYCLRGIHTAASAYGIGVQYLPFASPSDKTLTTVVENTVMKNTRVCVIMASTESWATEMSELLHQNNAEVIEIPCGGNGNDPRNHTICENYTAYMEDIYRYLIAGGKRNIALYGFKNVINDNRRVASFLHAHTKIGDAERLDILQNFRDDIREHYDAVVINNGTNAAVFMMQANAKGIRIPEELWVITTQATRIIGLISPSITTVSALDYYALGEDTIRLSDYIDNAGLAGGGQIHIQKEYTLIPRDSTSHFKPSVTADMSKAYHFEPNSNWMRKKDPDTVLCYQIEDALFTLEEWDLAILTRVLSRMPTERIAEEVHMSVSSVNHHIKSILGTFSCPSRNALINLFVENNLIR